MYEHRVYPRGEEESELWPTRENRKLSGVGKRPRESRLSEYLLGENRLMREFAAMRKCLPSFVTIQCPTGSLDWRRFDVEINLMGEILHNEHYGGRSYRFKFRVPKEYPVRPPLVECVTPVFHPNIGEEGSVGLKMLRAGEAGISSCYGWQATDTIEGIIFRLYRLFFNPCNEDTFVLNKNAAYHYRRNPTGFKSLVRRAATATISHSKQELNLPARNKYYSDSESFCSSTSSSQSADYYH